MEQHCIFFKSITISDMKNVEVMLDFLFLFQTIIPLSESSDSESESVRAVEKVTMHAAPADIEQPACSAPGSFSLV